MEVIKGRLTRARSLVGHLSSLCNYPRSLVGGLANNSALIANNFACTNNLFVCSTHPYDLHSIQCKSIHRGLVIFALPFSISK